jgi:hypothetical protein
MDCRKSTKELVAAYRAGDQTAAAEIHERFEKLLRAYAQRKIGSKLRRYADVSGILQSAWAEFFEDVRQQRIDVNDTNHAKNLLARKLWWRIMKLVRRCPPPEPTASLEVADGHAPPELAAALCDELAFLLENEDTRDAEIVWMSLQGFAASEIAAGIGASRWTVRRVQERFGRLLHKRFQEYARR